MREVSIGRREIRSEVGSQVTQVSNLGDRMTGEPGGRGCREMRDCEGRRAGHAEPHWPHCSLGTRGELGRRVWQGEREEAFISSHRLLLSINHLVPDSVRGQRRKASKGQQGAMHSGGGLSAGAGVGGGRPPSPKPRGGVQKGSRKR